MTTDGSDERRPHGREHEPAQDDQRRSQEELNRTTLGSGGDAPAAASIEAREAAARDEEPFFDEEPERDQEDG